MDSIELHTLASASAFQTRFAFADIMLILGTLEVLALIDDIVGGEKEEGLVIKDRFKRCVVTKGRRENWQTMGTFIARGLT